MTNSEYKNIESFIFTDFKWINVRSRIKELFQTFSIDDITSFIIDNLNKKNKNHHMYLTIFFMLPDEIIIKNIDNLSTDINLNLFQEFLVQSSVKDKEAILISYLKSSLLKNVENIDSFFEIMNEQLRESREYFPTPYTSLQDSYKKRIPLSLQETLVELYVNIAQNKNINYNALSRIIHYLKDESLSKIEQVTLNVLTTPVNRSNYYYDSYLHNIEYRFKQIVTNKKQFIQTIIPFIQNNIQTSENEAYYKLFDTFSDRILKKEYSSLLDIQVLEKIIIKEYSLQNQIKLIQTIEHLGLSMPYIKEKIIKKHLKRMTSFRGFNNIGINELNYIFSDVIKSPSLYSAEINSLLEALNDDYKVFIFDTLVRVDYQKKEVKGYDKHEYIIIANIIRYLMKIYTRNVKVKKFIIKILKESKNNIFLLEIAEGYEQQDNELEEIAASEIKVYLSKYEAYRIRITALSKLLTPQNNGDLIEKLLNINNPGLNESIHKMLLKF